MDAPIADFRNAKGDISVLEALPGDVLAEIDIWVKKFRPEQKQSAVIPALTIVQKANKGYVTRELMDAIAVYLAIPKITVYEVATFYSMFDTEPTGEHKINICTNVSCMLAGAKELVEHAKQRLGVELNEPTADKKYVVREVECLGRCIKAPCCYIGEDYHVDLTAEKLDKIIDELSTK